MPMKGRLTAQKTQDKPLWIVRKIEVRNSSAQHTSRKPLFATTRVYRRYSSEFQQSRLGTRLEGIVPEFGKSDVISRTVDLRHYFRLATIRELASLPAA